MKFKKVGLPIQMSNVISISNLVIFINIVWKILAAMPLLQDIMHVHLLEIFWNITIIIGKEKICPKNIGPIPTK